MRTLAIIVLGSVLRLVQWATYRWRSRHTPPAIRALQRQQADADARAIEELGW